ncbi:ferredoxin [Streptomyces sp. GbtcB6]|uniref:ferredoxin n=1 Tax=Streptomyces sp. GbtcB6 TaxID=2824751 RepID=UPI001C311104|nr:ferredoxin [Streptomyces sp. GbtcB6]
MNVKIDLGKCDGYANCVIEADRVFDIDDGTGQAVLLTAIIGPELADEVRRAQARCPVQAIRLED